MAKDGFLTPKAIANRIKAKGLQKLRWYCQMCQKQCRDANGFKCHLTSESHQRQMAVFTENPSSFLDDFSKEFEDQFMDLIRRSYKTKKVKATRAYNEHIADRHHVHMNATKWSTLTEFVKYLGRTGKCQVEETPKGWYIRYIDRDEQERMEKAAKKERADIDAEEIQKREMQKMYEAALALEAEKMKQWEEEELAEHLNDGNIDEEKLKETKVAFSLSSKPKSSSSSTSNLQDLSTEVKKETPERTDDRNHEESTQKRSRADIFGIEDDTTSSNKKLKPQTTKMSALEELKAEQEAKKNMGANSGEKKKEEYEIPWVRENIIVKVMNKKLVGGKYYKQKGKVVGTSDNGFVGHIEILQTGDVLKIDQSELETVIPAIGFNVMIVRGKYKGQIASLESIDQKRFCCTVKLKSGEMVDKLEYEDICKYAGKS